MLRRVHPIIAMLMLVAVYFAAGKFGLMLAFVNASATPVWPATGLAIAALLLGGLRLWPGVFIGAFLVNISTQGSVASSLGIATGNTLEAVIAAALAARFARGASAFDRAPDVFKYVFLAAIPGTLISASFGASSLVLDGLADWDHYGSIWVTWWLGDLTSSVTVAPLIVVVWRGSIPPVKVDRILEGAGVFGITAAIGQVVFGDILPFVYLTLLPVAWAAYRFGARTVLAVMVVTSTLALDSALRGYGRFSLADPNEAMLYLQAFMSINTVMALVLTAAIAERKKAERRLQIQYGLSRVLAEARTLEEGAPKILEALGEMGGWDVGVIWRVDAAARELFCAEVWQRAGIAIPELAADIRRRKLSPDKCLPGEVWSAGEPLWVTDIGQRENFPRAAIALREGLHTALAFPLKVDQEILGVVECFSRRVREPDAEFMQTLAALGSQTGQLIERQRAAEVLRDSEARFRQLAEHIREVFWVSDVEKSNILYVSQAYETIWGRTCASLYQDPRNWLEAIDPEHRERVREAAMQKQVTGQYDVVYRIIRPDGEGRWIRDRAFPVKNQAGIVYRIVGIAEDITAQRKIEESLRQSEARKRAIMESALDGILTIDAAGRMLELNTAAEQMFGCGRGNVMGEELAALFLPAAARQWFERGLGVQFAGNEGPVLGARLEVTARRADGNEFPAEFTLTRPDLAGPPVFTLFFRDITKRKQTEAQIATLAQAVASTAEMICITDLEDRFVFANRAFLETYGYTEAEILGQTPEILFSPNNPPGKLQEILIGTRAGGWRGEVLDRRKDGSEFPISLSTSGVRDANGRVIGLMGISQDITERKRAEEQYRRLADAVQSAQEIISITDAENQFTFVNEAFLKTYGLTREEVLGRTPHFLYAPENPPGLCERVHHETLRGGWQGELMNLRKDGRAFPISLSTSQIRGPDGKMLGLAGFARDISERRRMERQSAAFAALGHRLSAAVTAEQAAEIILDISAELFAWDAGYVDLYSESEDRVVPILTLDTIDGKHQQISPSTYSLTPSALMRSVMKSGAKLINRATETSDVEDFVVFGDKHRRSASLMYVPIKIKHQVLGVLSVQSYRPQAYGEADLVILQALADYGGDALQRIQAAESLRVAETKYRSIFENVSEGIYRVSPEGKFLSANPAMARMFGYESVEAIIAGATEPATFPTPEAWAAFVALVQHEGGVLAHEAERVRQDGSRLWVSTNARRVREEAGQPAYYEGTCRDVTDRKRSEAVLRDSEQRFRTLFESAPIAIALHADTGRILETNHAYQLMVGYTADELRGLGVKAITHPDDVAEGARLHAEMAAGRRDHYRREKRYQAKDGHEVWATAHATALRDVDGGLRYIISVVEDITEHRRAQTQLRDLAAIVESSNDAILSTTQAGDIASWNRAAEQIYGYQPEEVIGRPFTILSAPDQAEELAEALQAVELGRRIENFETVLRCKDASLVEMSLTISPVRDAAGRVIGASAIGRDIGPRRQLEREILESSANERRRIGHDLHDGLGQILAGIALKTRVLQEALTSEGSAQVQESEEIVRLVNDSIRQTRTLARGLDPVDAGANGLLAALQTLAVQAEYLFRIECDFRSTIQRLALNAPTGIALYRIAQEAIHNAVSHGQAQQIEIELAELDDQLSLRIRDDGRGFNPAAVANPGMGLRIMQYRANSIGGRLTFYSEPNQWTVVECTVSKRLSWPHRPESVMAGE